MVLRVVAQSGVAGELVRLRPISSHTCTLQTMSHAALQRVVAEWWSAVGEEIKGRLSALLSRVASVGSEGEEL